MNKVMKLSAYTALATFAAAGMAGMVTAQDTMQNTMTREVVSQDASPDGTITTTRAVAVETSTQPVAMVATHTVQTVMASPKPGAKVTLIGTLGAKVGHNTYAFTDRTGTIYAEISKKQLPANVQMGQMVRIDGEVDWTGFIHRTVEINAERVTVI